VNKGVIKILQGSVVTQTVLGGLAIYPPVANFLQYIYAKNYENPCAFFWPTLYITGDSATQRR